MSDSLPAVAAKPKPWGIWTTLALSLVVFGVFFAAQTLVFLAMLSSKIAQDPALNPEILAGSLSQNGFVLAIATLVSSPICIALLFFFARLRNKASAQDYLGLRRPHNRQILEWCLVAIVCNVTIDLVKSFTDLPMVPQFVIDIYETAYVLPVFWLAVVVMAPLFEEIFFRGFIFQGIKHSTLKTSGAIALTSVIWAMIHVQYDLVDVAGIFAFGLVLGVARIRTGSTYIPIVMHALGNLLALLQVTWYKHFL